MSEITYQQYRQYREQRQSEFNALPIFYAFNNEQLERGMKTHWDKPGRCPMVKNAKKYLFSIGAGGFYFKHHSEIIRDWLTKPDPIDELLKDPKFAEDAFYYEMENHEYHINYYQGNWDVLSCFGNVEYRDDDSYEEYFKELGFEEQTKEAYRKARKRFLHDADKYDWY